MMHLKPSMARVAPAMFVGTVCGKPGDMTDDAAKADCPDCLHWHSLANLDTFTEAYIACALWSSNDESTPSGGEPFDSNYSAEDIAPKTLAKMIAECAEFQKANRDDLEAASEMPGYDSASQAGHDFWLTRNGHGAGFWDRGLGKLGDKLSDAARACGGRDLYLGDDGKIWH